MSCLQNEMILENLFDEVWEDFRVSNKLTVNQMNELCSFSKGTVDNLERLTQQRFEDLSQYIFFIALIYILDYYGTDQITTGSICSIGTI